MAASSVRTPDDVEDALLKAVVKEIKVLRGKVKTFGTAKSEAMPMVTDPTLLLKRVPGGDSGFKRFTIDDLRKHRDDLKKVLALRAPSDPGRHGGQGTS